MNCAVHTDVNATGYCRQCGKALCPACTREMGGALYCETCSTSIASTSAATPPKSSSGGHPGAALALGFIPGLGAVYNGEYIKALIQVVIFAGIIAALNTDLPDSYTVFLSIGLGCFCCYMPIDSYRVAKARRSGEPQPPDLLMQGGGKRPIGAIVLIVLGLLFLLANFGLLQKEWLAKAWPIGLIALGIWILMDRMRRDS
jgi:hypothetical protein